MNGRAYTRSWRYRSVGSRERKGVERWLDSVVFNALCFITHEHPCRVFSFFFLNAHHHRGSLEVCDFGYSSDSIARVICSPHLRASEAIKLPCEPIIMSRAIARAWLNTVHHTYSGTWQPHRRSNWSPDSWPITFPCIPLFSFCLFLFLFLLSSVVLSPRM